MATEDDIARLKAEENRAKGRLGYVETQYRDRRDESRAGMSDKQLDERDQEIGRLTSQRNTLETTVAVKEAERQELERGRDALAKQSGRPERGPGEDGAPSPEPQLQGPAAPQAPATATQSQDHPQEQGRSGPDAGSSGGPASTAPEQQTSDKGTGPEQERESRLPPFGAPPPGGFGPWDSRETPPDRFFKPVDDVQRIKNEQELSRHYMTETDNAAKEVAWQQEQSKKEMEKLGLDQKGQDEFRLNEFTYARDKMNTLFQQQDQQLKEVHALNTVADSTMVGEQNDKREASRREVDNHRFDVTYNICKEPATVAVGQQYASDLEKYGQRLDREQMAGQDKQDRLDNFSARLQEHQPADIQATALGIQQQAFPEVVANGPQFTQQQRTDPNTPPM